MTLREFMDIRSRELNLRAIPPTEEERRAARAYERQAAMREQSGAIRIIGPNGIRDATPEEVARYLAGDDPLMSEGEMR